MSILLFVFSALFAGDLAEARDRISPDVAGADTFASVADLCEPVSERRPFPTPAERRATRVAIRRTCAAMGVHAHSCAYFIAGSLRESTYRPWARHKLAGDRSAALAAYFRNAHRYGWWADWPTRAQKREDLSKIFHEPRAYSTQNPHFEEAHRWEFGLGLGALNPADQLWRIDPMAPPEVLCDLTLNVFVQVSVARDAVRKYNATSWIEVQAVYGGRTYVNEDGKRRARPHARLDADICRRTANKGLDCRSRPMLGERYDYRGMSPAEVYAFGDRVRGYPLVSVRLQGSTIRLRP